MNGDMQTAGIDQYFERAGDLMINVLAQQRDVMREVADLWTGVIRNDGLIFTFGSGHSRFIAGELYFRAGGLAAVMQINDPANGMMERVEGNGTILAGKYDIRPKDTLLVVSNSGINPLPIEIAMAGKAAGVTVVAMTSLAYSREATSRHSSGKKLYEVADIILDANVPRGDVLVDVPDSEYQVAPVSTLISVSILNAIVAQVARNVTALDGGIPPVLVSANVPEGDAHNEGLMKKYWKRLTSFPLKTVGGG